MKMSLTSFERCSNLLKEDFHMTAESIQLTAAALYDGGWTSDDREWLMDEYKLTPIESDLICQELRWIEDEN